MAKCKTNLFVWELVAFGWRWECAAEGRCHWKIA